PGAVHLPVEDDARGPGRVVDEQLAEDGHDSQGRRADAVRDDGHVPPAEDPEALFGHDRFDGGLDLPAGFVVARAKGEPYRAGTRRWQWHADDGAKQAIGHLHGDAGAITGIDLGTRRAAVLEVAHGAEAQLHDPVAGPTLHVDDERDAARVVLEA